MEVWKVIDQFEGNYEVSNLGRVRSTEKTIVRSNGWSYPRKSKILKPAKDPGGYMRCAVSHKGKLITCKMHRLVAQAFLPNESNLPVVNHINCDKTDNRVENLEWCTAKENAYHAISLGRFQMVADDKLRERSVNKIPKSGSLNGVSKLTEDQVLEIRAKYIPTVYTRKMLAAEFGVDHTTIKDIVNRRSWVHV